MNHLVTNHHQHLSSGTSTVEEARRQILRQRSKSSKTFQDVLKPRGRHKLADERLLPTYTAQLQRRGGAREAAARVLVTNEGRRHRKLPSLSLRRDTEILGALPIPSHHSPDAWARKPSQFPRRRALAPGRIDPSQKKPA